jgi:hypothetical protein
LNLESIPTDGDSRIAQWASSWLHHQNPRGQELWNEDGPTSPDPQKQLREAGISVVAVCRDRILEHLNCPLKVRSNPELAKALNVSWDTEFVRWIFDTDLVPEEARESLSRLFGESPDRLFQQDWQRAEREALRAAGLRDDLGWPFDVAGWAAERRGERTQAIQFYQRGLKTSLFADETVRFRTHWFPEGFGKFAAARLAELRDDLPAALLRDPYLGLFWENDARSLRERLSGYWSKRARDDSVGKRYLHAYQCFYRAGWDCGLSDLDGFAVILEGLCASAKAAGAAALACLAEMHLRHLP